MSTRREPNTLSTESGSLAPDQKLYESSAVVGGSLVGRR